MRFLPDANAAVMAAPLSAGLAMKKLSIGMDVPGVAPLAQLVPEELSWTDGTKTL